MQTSHLYPKCTSLPNRRQLRGLKVREPESGQVAILTREGGETVDDDYKLGEDEGEGFAEEDEVGIARSCRVATEEIRSEGRDVLGDIARCCA